MRAMFRLAGLVALAACGRGEVELRELDPMGPVRSAAWVELTVGEQTLHEFVAADVPDLCDQTKDAAAALVRAVEAHALALEAAIGDPLAVCAADRAFHEAAHDATRTLLRSRAHFVTVLFDDREGDPEDPPRDGPYEIGDADDPTFVGWLTVVDRNPFRAEAERACDDGALGSATEGALDQYATSGGTADAELRGSDRYVLSVDALLGDSGGGTAGHLGLSARYDRCVVEVDPVALPLIPFLVGIASEPVDTGAPDSDAPDSDAPVDGGS